MKLIFLIFLLPVTGFAQMDVCKELTGSGVSNKKTVQPVGTQSKQIQDFIKKEFENNDEKGKKKKKKNQEAKVTFPYLIIEVPAGEYSGDEAILLDENVLKGKGICLVGLSRPIIERKKFDAQENERAIIKIKNVSNVVVKGFELKGAIVSDSAISPVGISVRNFNSTPVSNIRIEDNFIHFLGHTYEHCSSNISCGQAHGIDVNALNGQITGIHIEKNKLTNLRLGRSEAITVVHNVSDFTISDNEIWNVDNIGIDVGGGTSSSLLHASKGVIQRNKVYGLVWSPYQNESFPFVAGIYIDGASGTNWSDGISVTNNNVSDFGIGISVGSENDYCREHSDKCQHVLTQFITVENNTLTRNQVYGLGIGKDSPEQNSYTWHVRISGNTITGNNLYAQEAGYSDLHFGSLEQDSLKAIEVSNNSIRTTVPTTYMVRVVGAASRPDVTFTGNTFWKSSEVRIWSWAGQDFDKNSLFDPSTNISRFPRDAGGKQIIIGDNNRWLASK